MLPMANGRTSVFPSKDQTEIHCPSRWEIFYLITGLSSHIIFGRKDTNGHHDFTRDRKLISSESG